METLQAIPTVMAVAGGIKKASAILAALRGGYIDILVTDAVVATAILSLNGNRSESTDRPNIMMRSEVLING
jgi:dihydroxyacetone kinase-like protein